MSLDKTDEIFLKVIAVLGALLSISVLLIPLF